MTGFDTSDESNGRDPLCELGDFGILAALRKRVESDVLMSSGSNGFDWRGFVAVG